MRLASIQENDTSNSISGFTQSIWFQGCSNNCDDCWNTSTWNYLDGYAITENELIDIIKKNRHKNVSLLGGDPFYYQNREEAIHLIKRIRRETNKTIYVWSGYSKEEIEPWIDLSLIDYLIEGKFDNTKKDLSLVMRGSKNQRIFKNGVEIYL